MANGTNGEISGFVKIVQTILTTSGPVALLAIALAGFLMWSVNSRLNVLSEGVSANFKEIQTAKIDMRAYVAQQTELDKARNNQMELLIKITRQMCLNSAKNEDAIRGCLGEQ